MSDENPVSIFRRLYEADAREEKARPLEDYLERCPGDAEGVARAYLEIRANETDGERLGPYELLKELGRGGQGIVYLAEDSRLKRRVALKVLTGLGPGSQETLQRFQREAEVASKLEHPAICAVHEAGSVGGVPFIAMRYVEGESLAERLQEARSADVASAETSILDLTDFTDGPDAPEEEVALDAAPHTLERRELENLLKVFESTARALHVAHEAGIVHRDIKPANVMVTAGGQPVILDFGMARDDDTDGPSLTQSGDLFGTPAYMSPEQLMGQRIVLDRRTDIWSLAVSLYECLTLEKPFDSPTRQGLYQAVMAKAMPDPRKINKDLPPDLVVVLATALDKDRDGRYQTAEAFADEIQRVRERRPIVAKRAGPLKRVVRWAQRNPAVAALAAGLVVASIAAAAFLSYGFGAQAKAKVERDLREFTERDRDRIRKEGEAQARILANRKLRERLEEISASLGLMWGAIGGRMAVESICTLYIDAFDDYGLPLDGSVSTAGLVEKITTLGEIDTSMRDYVIGYLLDMRKTMDGAGIGQAVSKPEGGAEPDPLAPVYERLIALLDALPKSEAETTFQKTLETFDKTYDFELLDTYLERERFDELTPDQRTWLAMTALNGFKKDFHRAVSIMDRVLLLKPDDYLVQFGRSGISMNQGSITQDPQERRKFFERGVHHALVARALRPRSALAAAMTALSLGSVRRGEEAVRTMDEATRLEKVPPGIVAPLSPI